MQITRHFSDADAEENQGEQSVNRFELRIRLPRNKYITTYVYVQVRTTYIRSRSVFALSDISK